MLAGATYQEIYEGFRWRVPKLFNIGTACTDALPPGRLALIDVSDGERHYTFGQLSELTNRMANALTGLGLEPGDRIAVVLPQIAATAIAHVGAYKAGLISVPLSSLFGADASWADEWLRDKGLRPRKKPRRGKSDAWRSYTGGK